MTGGSEKGEEDRDTDSLGQVWGDVGGMMGGAREPRARRGDAGERKAGRGG